MPLTHVLADAGLAAKKGQGRPLFRRVKAGRRHYFNYSTIGLALVFVIFMGLWAATQTYMQAVAMVDHSHAVRRSVFLMTQGLVEAQDSQRGYLLTHQQEYLQPYIAAHQKARQSLDEASRLTEDNPAQQERIRRLRVLVNSRLDELDKVLLVDRDFGSAAARTRLQTGEGRVIMNHIQVLSGLFTQEESALLVRRSKHAEWLSFLLIGGLLGFAAILSWFVWFGVRQLERENALEKELSDMLGDTLAEKDTLLEQRELLLAEVNHRVKNSLNQVASILRLQMRGLGAGQDTAKEALTSALNRINAIGRVHEQMYRSETIGQVDARVFLEPLAKEILNSLLVVDGNAVTLDCQIDSLPLSMERAVPLTLLMNELLTNAAKYGPVKGRKCTIKLALRSMRDGTMTLSVSDNGPGLPKNFAPDTAKSLGMRLVTQLSQQLNGRLTVASSTKKGTTFTLSLLAT